MKKNRLAILAIATTLVIGGTIMTVQNKSLFTDDIFGFQSPREKQLTYLKKHEKDLADFVKSLNPKVDSVQIAWEETRWEEIGNGTPQGGGNVIRVFGGFNHIKDSSWSVLVYIKDGKNNEEDFIEGIGSGSPLRVGGRGFDEE
ncbi:hypothetical protein J1C90_04620 [Streptococcus sanguinis]|jgi:hypothetical protein|uniref:Lipoprotein n=2 Tax=Streptococcus sanguinis TaxID=1305 RepID=F0IUE1_STRSA|nr:MULTISPECIES: hypothetical protein [Streptococcus]EGD38473.1 lipoprotein [Streptococcus sanguinis SK160]EGF19418.1 lipoprotein [Streptococcus sanguinis SK408]ETD08710.1 hypothetical protein HMPREF1196_00500 [Streptococcus sanguinis CC94A]MCY7032039.1 hypothetical protein [Streptococcus sanguinis]RSI02938.1 hypothetical protein D8892_06000 [Streptococcus sanguinis]